MKINEILSQEDKEDILKELFGFEYHDRGDGTNILYDEDGDIVNVSFSTLKDIFKYNTTIQRQNGYVQFQREIREKLGL